MDNIFSIGTADGYLRGIEFNNDGTKMYLIGLVMTTFNNSHYQQHMQLERNHMMVITILVEMVILVHIICGGIMMDLSFLLQIIVHTVIEYSVSNAYDVTTGTVTEGTNFSVSSYESDPLMLHLILRTKMYVIGNE